MPSKSMPPDPVEELARDVIHEWQEELEFYEVYQAISQKVADIDLMGIDVQEFAHEVYQAIVNARLIVKFQ